MLYPNDLLPKENFKKILTEFLPKESFLIRKSCNPDPELVNEVRIDELYNDKKPEELFGWSSNLLGIFQSVHLIYEPIKNDLEYLDEWNPGDEILSPDQIIFETNYNIIPLFIRIFDFHNESFPYEKPLKQRSKILEGKILIQHKPIKCNFWHFEFEIYDEKGTLIKKSDSKWRKDAALRYFKHVLSRMVSKEHPPIVHIPTQLYSEN